MSSKKKLRREKYLEREAKRKREYTRRDAIKNASTMEDLAKAMGIKLK